MESTSHPCNKASLKIIRTSHTVTPDTILPNGRSAAYVAVQFYRHTLLKRQHTHQDYCTHMSGGDTITPGLFS